MSKFSKGAKNAVKCLNISKNDRVVIVTDKETSHIAKAVSDAIEATRANVTIFIIEEEVGERPVRSFPDKFMNKIKGYRPSVSYYIASGKEGELEKFRMPLLNLLTKDLKCRHGHMISINDQLMLEGMSADYDKIFELTNSVYGQVKNAKKIRVTAEGTDLEICLDENLRWKVCTGRIEKQGDWNNLPEGEVFTTPGSIEGKISAFVVGDYFSSKYGVLKDPLIIKIKDSKVSDVICKNEKMQKEFSEYIRKHKNGNKVGEFAIGTLVGLEGFTGNLLQDEKFPGIHIAFGSPYPHDTGADWDCPTHIDVIPVNCTIEVDGKLIMKDGEFTL